MTKDLRKELYFENNAVTTLEEIKDLANKLLKQLWIIDIFRYEKAKEINLDDLGWKFEFNSRKKSTGLCDYNLKKIFISEFLLKQNLNKAKEFENTIRHEIAHAIDFEMGFRSGHGKIWKVIALKVLCNGERCYDSSSIKVDTSSTRYKLVCPKEDCDFELPRFKKRKKNARRHACCSSCYHKGRGYIKLEEVQNF